MKSCSEGSIEVGLAGSTCFSSTDKNHRRTVILDKDKQQISPGGTFEIQIRQLRLVSFYMVIGLNSNVGSYFYLYK
jgi:hypothetical protein